MVDKLNPVPEEFAQLLATRREDLLDQIRRAQAEKQRAINITGATMDDIIDVAATTGWLIKIDKKEGSPPGGFFFLQNPDWKNESLK